MFELNVVSNTPLTPIEDIKEASLEFLKQIGYISKGYDPKTDVDNIQESIPYRLFTECFLGNLNRVWAVEELSAYLSTTKPTVYRHLNKLKAIDVLEDISIDIGGQRKKGYRIRYGDLGKAWSFTEANVDMAMQSYRRTVEHLQRLAKED